MDTDAMKAEQLPVTVIVPVRNEARNIAHCLETLGWADQVFVVDSNSDDGTAEIAGSHGASVVQFGYKGGWPKKKNWAISNLDIANEWILIVDADERITPELQGEIGRAIARADVTGFYVRWKFIFLGRWMKYSWNHGWMLRLFRRGHGAYEDLGMRGEGGWDNEVHEHLVVTGKTDILHNYLVHDSNQPLESWLQKQNQFSTWNAARRWKEREHRISWMGFFSRDPLARRKALKGLYLRMPLKPLFMFLHLYVVRMGFLDGKAGLYFCALRAIHELNTSAKMFEARTPARNATSSKVALSEGAEIVVSGRRDRDRRSR